MKINNFRIQTSGLSAIAIMSFWLAFAMQSGDKFEKEQRKIILTVQNSKFVNSFKQQNKHKFVIANISDGFSAAADSQPANWIPDLQDCDFK